MKDCINTKCRNYHIYAKNKCASYFIDITTCEDYIDGDKQFLERTEEWEKVDI